MQPKICYETYKTLIRTKQIDIVVKYKGKRNAKNSICEIEIEIFHFEWRNAQIQISI